MARDLYIHEQKSENRLLRKVMILLLVLILLGGSAFGYLLISEQRAADQALLEFASALEKNEYEKALPLYREIQEKALTGGLFGRNRELYDDARISMELLTSNRLVGIEAQLRADRALTASELGFVGKMNEVTAVHITTLIRAMCEEYLSDQITLPVLKHALDQLSGFDNLKIMLGPLPAQLEQMVRLQPAIAMARNNLQDKKYLSAAAAFKTMTVDEAAGPFVRQFAVKCLDETRAAMYQPLIGAIDQAMSGSRYLTAAAAIQDLLVYFPEDTPLQTKMNICKSKTPAKMVIYRGTIEHIVIKPLIVNPAAAFDGDSYAKAAEDSMLTTTEFTRILDGLYQNKFVLIDATKLADSTGKILQLELPEGKKPLVLTIEGLNYYATRRKTGNCENLALNQSGQVCGQYVDASGKVQIDRKAEAIGILDAFVEAHPDFSFDGAKGTVSLTGYECVFGYITDADQKDDRTQALAANNLSNEQQDDATIAENRTHAIEIMDQLKKTGWIFASSTYGFIDAKNQKLDRIKADTEKWLTQVGSMTGPVRILHYPNGAFISGSDERARYLISQGFTIFGGIGVSAYQYAGVGYLYFDKTPLNGFTLKNHQAYQLSRFFNPAGVLDAARPKK
jgi:hypothetical protein